METYLVIFDAYTALPVDATRISLTNGTYYFYNNDDGIVATFSEETVSGVAKAKHTDIFLFENLQEALLMQTEGCGECPACLAEAEEEKQPKKPNKKSKLDIN